MIQFILKRLGQAVIVVFLVTIITFILLQSQPGGAARAALGKDATQEQLAAFDHENGYDRPIPEQYVTYLNKIAHGDFGYSYQHNQSVNDLLAAPSSCPSCPPSLPSSLRFPSAYGRQ